MANLVIRHRGVLNSELLNATLTVARHLRRDEEVRSRMGSKPIFSVVAGAAALLLGTGAVWAEEHENDEDAVEESVDEEAADDGESLDEVLDEGELDEGELDEEDLFDDELLEIDDEGEIDEALEVEDINIAEPAATAGLSLDIINFDFDSEVLSEQAKMNLAQVASWMRANPDSGIELIGHTDPDGSDTYNIDLGQRRANQCKVHLMSMGVDASRIVASTRGKMDSIEGEQPQSRRVTVRPIPLDAGQAKQAKAPVKKKVTVIRINRPAPVEAPSVALVIAEKPAKQLSVSVGGGVMGFTDSDTRDFTDDVGGAWDVRLAYGTSFYISGEAAYVGSATNINALGLDSGSVLIGNGVEGNLRVNFTKDNPLQPYVFGGGGYTRYHLSNSSFNTSSVKDDESAWHIPMGAGLGYRTGGFRVDVRGDYRYAIDDNLARGITAGGVDAEADLDSWGASAKLGWEF